MKNSTNVTELTSIEVKHINGGTEPYTTSVYDDGSQNGCTRPGHFPIPYPTTPILY
ncbi:hypothetical protein [Aquimarina algiphila]|uniref:hypothetical protein n=1 Tax=Aquimarina algiphila TaxID=2047982 RepID=UPI00232B4B47|nr:hypothetical protein [Aquimarina algiphila]